jgi:hypothetical protein
MLPDTLTNQGACPLGKVWAEGVSDWVDGPPETPVVCYVKTESDETYLPVSGDPCPTGGEGLCYH